MVIKDWLLIVVAFLGWTWAIAQYFLNRKLQKKDKLVDRRYEAYSNYMKKSDELMHNLRNDPKTAYGLPSDFFKALVNHDEKEINKASISFNETLKGVIKNASEPTMILNKELSSLLLVCSKELQSKIEKYKLLAQNHSEEIIKILESITYEIFINNQKDFLANFQEGLLNFNHDKRWEELERLDKEILELMRSELCSK
jgi:hypothetical protein